MNKNQLTMTVIGGAGGALALIISVMAFMNGSELGELQAKVSADRSSRDAMLGVSRKSGNEMKAASEALREDAVAAYSAVTNGALLGVIPDRTSLQKLMNGACERYKKLPVDSPRKIIKEDFTFGPFGEYIKGAIPAEKETARLTRRWGDVSELTDILIQAGATELTDVKIITKKEEVESARPGSRGSRGRNVRNARNESEAGQSAYACSEESYEITFLARPAALVRFMNALCSSRRFFVIDSLKFEQSGDPLLQAIGAEAKEDTKKNRSDAETDEVGHNKVCVTDPATTVPFTVTMKVTTMIFAEKKEAK